MLKFQILLIKVILELLDKLEAKSGKISKDLLTSSSSATDLSGCEDVCPSSKGNTWQASSGKGVNFYPHTPYHSTFYSLQQLNNHFQI